MTEHKMQSQFVSWCNKTKHVLLLQAQIHTDYIITVIYLRERLLCSLLFIWFSETFP